MLKMSNLTYLTKEAMSLAEHVTQMTGESMAEAIEVALKERHERLAPVVTTKPKRDIEGARKLIAECRAIVKEHGFTFNFDELYDENGLPK
jgi:hypothetical protein